MYELVERNGRGAIYLGSSRIDKEHAHFARSKSLAKAVAVLLECTTWSGIGPGLMDADLRRVGSERESERYLDINGRERGTRQH